MFQWCDILTGGRPFPMLLFASSGSSSDAGGWTFAFLKYRNTKHVTGDEHTIEKLKNGYIREDNTEDKTSKSKTRNMAPL